MAKNISILDTFALTGAGLGSSILHIDSNHFIVAWRGVDDDGFVQTLEFNTSTYVIATSNNALEFDATQGYAPVLCKIDTNHFLCVWSGSGFDGFAQVFTVNTSTWAVTTANSTLEFDTVQLSYPNIIQISETRYLVAWAGSGDDGFVQVLAVNTSTWAVTTANNRLEFDTQNGEYNNILQIDANHFLIVWSGYGDDGFAQVFTVNTSTWAVTTANNRLEFDTVKASFIETTRVDTNHVLVAWQNSGGYAQVLAVNTTTWAVTTAASSLNFTTTWSRYNKLLKIDTNNFLLLFSDTDSDGEANVLNVNTTTWAVATTITTVEIETDYFVAVSGIDIDSEHFIIAYAGPSSTATVMIMNVRDLIIHQAIIEGDLNFTGTVNKKVIKFFNGALSVSGAITSLKKAVRIFEGTLNLAGGLAKKAGKVVSGVLSFTGSLNKKVSKFFAGVLNLVGQGSKTWKQLCEGTLNLGGSVTKGAKKVLTGTLTMAGTIVRKVQKVITGLFSAEGATTKKISKFMSGILTVGGIAGRIYHMTLYGTVVLSRELNKKVQKQVAGILSFIKRFIIHDKVVDTDTLSIAGTETEEIQNIHTVMNLPTRQIYGKIEVTYSDPFLDESFTASANGFAYNADPLQAIDGVIDTKQKWFSLIDAKLDGSYHPLPASRLLGSAGWWSDTMSEADGTFAVPPVLTLSFSNRTIREIAVYFDTKLDGYGVDFTVELLASDNGVLYTATASDNTLTTWTDTISPVENVCGERLTITKINRGYTSAKVVELYTAIVETYEGADIIDFTVLQEQESDEGTVAVGNISSNEINIRLNNSTRKFDKKNTDSYLNSFLKKNRRIKAWLGAYVGETLEWYQLGEFWSKSFDAPETDIYCDIVGWDRLEILRLADFNCETVYQDKTLYELAEIVLQDYGLTVDDYVLDAALSDTTIEYAFFDKGSYKDALKKIASAALGNVYCRKDGKIVITTRNTSATSLFTFDNDNLFSKKFPAEGQEIINYIEVKYQKRQPSDIQEIFGASDVFTIDAGASVTKTFNFKSNPCINASDPAITASEGITVSDWTSYSWGVQVTFTNTAETSGTVQSVRVDGQPLEIVTIGTVIAQDEASIREHGKITLSSPIASDFIQTEAVAQTIANAMLAKYTTSDRVIAMTGRGNIALNLGDRVTVYDYKTTGHNDYYILRQVFNYDGALDMSIDAQRV